MGRGSLAFVISLAIHAVVVGAFLRLPGGRGEASRSERAPVAGNTIMLCAEESEPAKDFVVEAPVLIGRRQPSPAAKTHPEPHPLAPANTGGTNPAPPVRGSSGGVSKAQAGGHGSGKGQATFFGVPVAGGRVVFLIDRSASMGPHGLLEAACREVIRCIGQLPAGRHFQIIVFNSTVAPLLPDGSPWLEPSPQEFAAVQRALETLQAEGKTVPGAALKFALSKQPDLLFFLTDAGEFRPELIRDIQRFNRGISAINVLALGAAKIGRNDSALAELARTNRGSFRRIATHSP